MMGASGDDANGKHYTLQVDKKKKIVFTHQSCFAEILLNLHQMQILKLFAEKKITGK